MTEKRDKIMIVAGILNACQQPKSKTRIVYACNLNFHTVKPYLELLHSGEFLSKMDDQYETTNKGLEAYKKITELYKLLGLDL